MRGAYVLVTYVAEAVDVEVGSLGAVRLVAGRHLYVGSAMNGVLPRVLRHFKRDKPVRWHIDRIRPYAEPECALLFPSPVRIECELARRVEAMSDSSIHGFGCSDCRCASHLFHTTSSLDGLVRGLGPPAILFPPNEPDSPGSNII